MKRLIQFIIAALTLVVLAYFSRPFFIGAKTMHKLLEENKTLQKAITSLTHEDQIGYAKVIKQEKRDGELYTTLRFVETDRDDPLNVVLEREYEIKGNVIHFDALIVSFPHSAVMDGKTRSLYLWRRIYGEYQSPADGFPIEEIGTAPARYAKLLNTLKLPEQQMFWEAIWDLSDNPTALSKYGIKAIYGNAVYKRLSPGLIYVFKIGADGQVTPETVFDM